ncbi:MAG: diguanylate cyclase [Myxococcales bacterium]|nr:diguanylate cyclase [Myxococcales bacterium]
MSVLDDEQRLAALSALEVMDTEPEPAFDAIVSAAAATSGMAISMISLLDQRRQWFKARVGLEGPNESPREHAICAHVVEQGATLEIIDALDDARFANNPFVAGPSHIRAYVGVPLVLSDGHTVGTLCVLDRSPKAINPAQRETLEHLARAAAALLDRRRADTSPTLDAVAANSQEAMIVVDFAGVIRSINSAAERLLSIEGERWIGRSIAEIEADQRSGSLERALSNVLISGERRDCELRVRDGDSASKRVVVSLVPVHDSGAKLVAIACVVRPRVVEREPTKGILDRALGVEIDRIASAPRDASHDSIDQSKVLLVDDDPTIIHLLRGALAEFEHVRFASNGSDALRIAREWKPGIILLDVELGDANGLDVCARIKADPEIADTPVIFVTAHDDILFEARAIASGATDFLSKPLSPARVRLRVHLHLRMRAQLEQLKQTVLTDELTRLANRRAFQAAISRECHRAASTGAISVLVIDIDYFKKLNDTYGHPMGDACLQSVAEAIAQSVSRPEDLCARIGGEEFAALLAGTEEAEARSVAERIRAAVIARAWPHGASPVAPHVTVSIGVAVRPKQSPTRERGAPTPAALVALADEALYRAKANGRNCVEVSVVATS